MTDDEGAKTMLVGVQVTLLAVLLPDWLPAAFPALLDIFGTALVFGGYTLD